MVGQSRTRRIRDISSRLWLERSCGVDIRAAEEVNFTAMESCTRVVHILSTGEDGTDARISSMMGNELAHPPERSVSHRHQWGIQLCDEEQVAVFAKTGRVRRATMFSSGTCFRSLRVAATSTCDLGRARSRLDQVYVDQHISTQFDTFHSCTAVSCFPTLSSHRLIASAERNTARQTCSNSVIQGLKWTNRFVRACSRLVR